MKELYCEECECSRLHDLFLDELGNEWYECEICGYIDWDDDWETDGDWDLMEDWEEWEDE